MAKIKKQERPTFSEFLISPILAGKSLKEGVDSWRSWLALDKVIFGEKLTNEEFKLYKKCCQRETIPDQGFEEIYVNCGRRGGKSFNAALIAIYLALFYDWTQYLSRGEPGFIFLVATDRTQAKVILSYIEGILQDFPGTVKKIKTLEIELNNGIIISIRPASFRSGRGYSTLCVIMDELAFWRSEESANPAQEVVSSFLPTLVEGGKLIGLSTPYSRKGYFWEIYRDYFGKEDTDILVWQAPTLLMNPNYSKRKMKRNIKRDRVKMTAEYYAEFRTDIESFLTEEMVEKIRADEEFVPFQPEQKYFAFTDPAGGGGGGDSFTLSVGHLGDNEIVIIDDVSEVKSPFDPTEVVETYSELLKQYECTSVVGDKFAPGWVSGAFKKQGINYVQSDLTKSEIYLYFQPLCATGKVKIPKSEKLKNQLLSLERRTGMMGKDVVDHPRGLKDDIANAVCGCAVLIHKGIFKRATPEELKARLPQVFSRLHPMKNLMRKMRQEGRNRMTEQEIKEQEKISEAKRAYKRKYFNKPERELDEIMGSEQIPCRMCGGQGTIQGEVCTKCRGTGTVRKYSRMTIVN